MRLAHGSIYVIITSVNSNESSMVNQGEIAAIVGKAVAMGNRGSGVTILMISVLPQTHGFTSDRISNDYPRWQHPDS